MIARFSVNILFIKQGFGIGPYHFGEIAGGMKLAVIETLLLFKHLHGVR